MRKNFVRETFCVIVNDFVLNKKEIKISCRTFVSIFTNVYEKLISVGSQNLGIVGNEIALENGGKIAESEIWRGQSDLHGQTAESWSRWCVALKTHATNRVLL